MDLVHLLRRFRVPPDRRAAVSGGGRGRGGRSTAKPEEEAEPESIDLAGVYRVEGTNPNGSKYRGMVALAQNDDQFNFTWWIGKDVFRGVGHFAGKMLVVNWGDKTPVIYTFGDEGALDGEWADGSATETLELVAQRRAG